MLSAVVVLALLGGLAARAPAEEGVVSPALEAEVAARASTDRIPVIIWLKEQPAGRIAREMRDKRSAERAHAATGVKAAEAGGDAAIHRAWRQYQKSVRGGLISDTLQKVHAETHAGQTHVIDLVVALGGVPTYAYLVVNAVAAVVPVSAVAALAQDAHIALISEDARLMPLLNVSTSAISAPTFWAAGLTGGTTDVAVFDSGVDRTHPAFAGVNIVDSVQMETAKTQPDFNDDPTTPDDKYLGHGTLVAGIVASQGSAECPTCKGVAFGLDKLYNVRVLYRTILGSNWAHQSDVIAGVDWIMSRSDPPEVGNASLGFLVYEDYHEVARLVDAIADTFDISAVIAAGNGGPGTFTVTTPGNAYNILSVANVDDKNTESRADDEIHWSSSRGPTWGSRKKPDVAAPGTSIYGPVHNWESASDYGSNSGTSFAAPHVVGALALLAHAGVDTAIKRKALLINTAQDMGTPGWDNAYGWGYLDLAAAYAARTFVLGGIVTAAGTPGGYRFYKGTVPTGGKASLVWNRHAEYQAGVGPAAVFPLNNLDLLLYSESTNAQVAQSASTIDNVEQVTYSGSAGTGILKVKAQTAPLWAHSTEDFALAVPASDFAEVGGPSLSASGANATVGVGQDHVLTMTMGNAGGLKAHSVQATLFGPPNVILMSGSNPQALGGIAAGAQQTASWTIRALSTAGSPIALSATVSSSSYGETLSGSGSVSLTVVSAGSVIVTKEGTGSGTVTSAPSGIACGGTCSAAYSPGTPVTLTATPAAGSVFAGWSWACSGTGTCAVTAQTAVTQVTAGFSSSGLSYALSASVKGSAGGTVSSDPAGLGCGSSCSASYAVNTVVTLTATAGSNAVFKSWGGACSGTATTCSVTVDVAKSVNATFSRVFTDGAGADATISAGNVIIKAAHVTELRSAIDKLRAVNGLAAFDWSDAALSPGSTPVRRVHFTELRTALGQAYQAAGQTEPTFTDATLTPAVTPVKAVHLNGLRQAVRLLE